MILAQRTGFGVSRCRKFTEYGHGALAVSRSKLFTDAHRYRGWILIDIQQGVF